MRIAGGMAKRLKCSTLLANAEKHSALTYLQVRLDVSADDLSNSRLELIHQGSCEVRGGLSASLILARSRFEQVSSDVFESIILKHLFLES